MDADRLKVPPFSWLPDDVRERFAVWVGELKVDAGRHLAEQGDYAYELFAIEDGKAEVLRDGEKIAELGPGDVFGEAGMLDDSMRSATVTATSRMRLISLGHFEVKRLKKNAPGVYRSIEELVEERS